MRTIKFRAWHKLERKMDEVTDLCLWRHLVYVATEQLSWTWNEIELMQFTGLVDRNGKEVYEGDIVRYLDNTAQGLVEKTIMIEDIRYLPDFQCSIWQEIVGNVYETVADHATS